MVVDSMNLGKTTCDQLSLVLEGPAVGVALGLEDPFGGDGASIRRKVFDHPSPGVFERLEFGLDGLLPLRPFWLVLSFSQSNGVARSTRVVATAITAVEVYVSVIASVNSVGR
jgi:hypothetical protein